ncbi:MAG: pyridoxal phosphate-dependent aminotransferase [Bacteroidota bacterium]|nr:pyridoxal phosphate-dependent aminotransferase [Candidatus Kapabacteria bacterium]MDW8219770.1 pyridoxal phosphate-dependent aminotransferase [Bacteroidota bacterium]
MKQLSTRVLAANESQTLAINAKAKAMKAQGIDVVSLSTGEPDFPTPQVVKDAAINAINQNLTYYTESNGIPELRKAIAEKFRIENKLPNVSPDTVLVSTGGKHSIFNALLAMCNEGDDVILQAPYWVSYPAMIQIAGARPVILETSLSSRYKITPAQLKAALTSQTKCVILNSPSNPTGTMYTPDEIRALAEVLSDHECFILSDELYEKISFGSVEHYSIGSLPELAHRVITVNGVSKAYSMTGWRIGYMTGPADLIQEAAKVQGQSTSNANSIAQRAALAALLHTADDVERMRKEFARRRTMFAELLSPIPNIEFLLPDGAFYMFVDIRKALQTMRVQTSFEFCKEALEQHHLAIVPGEAFGAPGCVRFSFAASDETLQKGIARFAKALQELT